MSINLTKNRAQLLESWKKVCEDGNGIDWALYGYEGQSDVLKVVSTGDGGITELKEDLNEGKIQYAFVRVQDLNTGLNKFILINWQGEGAQTLRKGTCAKHIYDVGLLLKGAHLTISASNEDDVDEDRILKRLATVTPKYNFKENKISTMDEKREPIGTNYEKKVIAKEINASERDEFWRKEEEEERKRQAAEAERKRAEAAKVEADRLKREGDANKTDTSARRETTTADQMRQQRSNEAKQLIGNRVHAAKAMFNQTSAPEEYKPHKSPTPVKPARSSIAKRVEALNGNSVAASQPEPEPEAPEPIVEEPPMVAEPEPEPEPQKIVVAQEVVNNVEPEVPVAQIQQLQLTNEPPIDDDEQFSTIKRSPHTKPSQDQEVEAVQPPPQQVVAENTYNEIETNEIGELTEDLQMFTGLKARALYDYQAADETEITFDPGDIITHIDQIDEGWWQGLGPDGRTYGLFPANYVEIIP